MAVLCGRRLWRIVWPRFGLVLFFTAELSSEAAAILSGWFLSTVGALALPSSLLSR
jgi:hypothetical protein